MLCILSSVPLLDLSALNEPDENMAPVKLLPRQELDDETARDGSVFRYMYDCFDLVLGSRCIIIVYLILLVGV